MELRISTGFVLVASWALLSASACTGAKIGPSPTGSAASGVQHDDSQSGPDADIVVKCDGAELGTPCGEAGTRRHCVYDACVRNTCGDGWPADGEQCDDGNEIDGDGCSSHCWMEVPPGCGNTVLEPGEQCDDGNQSNDDRCTVVCTLARCGDGILSAGEDCDDGNTADTDSCSSHCRIVGGAAGHGAEGGDAADGGGSGGIGGEDAGPGDAGNPVADSGGAGGAGGAGGSGGAGGAPGVSCDDCRALNCVAYQGVDWVAGCFDASATGDAVRDAVGADFSPSQVQACVDAMACAYANHCGHTAGAIANDCYCGAFGSGFGLDECNAAGPNNGAGDAPCSAAWRAATGQVTAPTVLGAISDVTTPAGWAYFLLECETTYCDGSADGDCTP